MGSSQAPPQCKAYTANRNIKVMGKGEGGVRGHTLGSCLKPYRQHATLYRGCVKSKRRDDKILSISAKMSQCIKFAKNPVTFY